MLLTVIVPAFNEETRILKALESIPVRRDLEILVIDDGSTDGTANVVKQFMQNNPDRIVRLISLPENKGLGNAKNVGYTHASGEYVNQLDADDWLYTEQYEKVMAELDGTDMVYMDLQITNGQVWRVTEATKYLWCGGTLRFIKKSFLGDHRCPEVRCAEDYFLNMDLQKIPHSDKFTGIVAYHYTFPREGSLCDLRNRGLL